MTALYAALLALLTCILSMAVIGSRGNPAFTFIAVGRGDDELLQRAIRAHGNSTEYVPTILIVFYFLKTTCLSMGHLHALTTAFLAGRVMHAICMGFMRSSMPLRVWGTALTCLPLLTTAMALLRQVLLL